MEKLKSILMALNSIEVHGEKNLNLLLGCIQALNAFVEEQGKQEHEYEVKNETV